jgi:hypothetical protein
MGVGLISFITSGVQRVTNTPTFRLEMKWTLARFSYFLGFD